jgi:hypothetical protein
MNTKLDHQKKNILFVVAMFLVTYMAYVLSFKHTLKAIALNNQLKSEAQFVQVADGSYAQVVRKNSFYNNVIKSYRVKIEDRENRLWQTVSGVAIAHQTAISLNPVNQIVADSTQFKRQIFTERFSFKGSYFNIVKLVDSLSKTPDIGKIASLTLALPKETLKEENSIQLDLTLNAVAN